MLFSKHSVLLPGSKVRPVLKKYHLELSITLPRDGIHDFLSKASFSVQPPLSFLTFHMKWSALIVLHYGGQLSCITPATHCVIIRNNVTMFLFITASLFSPSRCIQGGNRSACGIWIPHNTSERCASRSQQPENGWTWHRISGWKSE